MVNVRIQKRLIEIAYALRDKSVYGRCWHMSAVLRKSTILSIGINNYRKTHPQTKRFRYKSLSSVHSELKACLKLGLDDCSGLTIVNIRIDNNGRLNNSKFCAGCQHLIKSLNFKKALYTNKEGEFEKYEIE